MKKDHAPSGRPDVVAAVRGGDWSQPMDGEGIPADSTLEQALYWKDIYTDILAMEEKVLARIRQLMNTQSDQGRREVELTNVPVVVAQAERFRQRLGYWEERITQLDGNSNHHQGDSNHHQGDSNHHQGDSNHHQGDSNHHKP
jgi:hypothetical protein